MKAACEVCGSPLKSGANKVEIDGAIMVVCGNCARLGRPVGGAIVRPVRPNPMQSAFRSFSSAPSTPEFEVDPDYNLKIRQAREKLGLSQEDLGKMLNEKPSVIRMVESKKLKPDAVLTRKFMHYLKVNLLVSLSEQRKHLGHLKLTGAKSIKVLRIGHRYVRDYRTLTHLCLVSRALGAEVVYLEEIDDGLLESVREVNESWGGGFEVRKVPSWRSAIAEAKKEGRKVVHLTMYGMPLQGKLDELIENERFLVAVGGPKVPGEVYQLADYNIAVTSQPHSEIAALAIVLHEIQEGEELKKEFGLGKMRISPSERGRR